MSTLMSGLAVTNHTRIAGDAGNFGHVFSAVAGVE